MKKWATNVNIHGEGVSIESQLIKYLRGIFQGDSLSVLLFILSVNPLSFLLNKLKGYQIGKKNLSYLQGQNISGVDRKKYGISHMTISKNKKFIFFTFCQMF